MNVGSIVLATDQGLGYLAKDFFDNGVINDVMIVPHSSRLTHRHWYPDAPILKGSEYRSWLVGKDAMLFFETPFNWDIISTCKQMGIKTVLMMMHECTPERLPVSPDLLLCPSELDFEVADDYNIPAAYIPVPVPRHIQWKERKRVFSIEHNAGNGGLRGRNGTFELLLAINMISRPFIMTIRSQTNKIWSLMKQAGCLKDHRLQVYVGTAPAEELYTSDAFSFPEKFNGLSLPLQEAFASGMVVNSTFRFPNTSYLPLRPLVHPESFRSARVARSMRSFQEAVIEPEDIAHVIDDMLTYSTEHVKQLSERGRLFFESRQWDVLAPEYKRVLAS